MAIVPTFVPRGADITADALRTAPTQTRPSRSRRAKALLVTTFLLCLQEALAKLAKEHHAGTNVHQRVNNACRIDAVCIPRPLAPEAAESEPDQ